MNFLLHGHIEELPEYWNRPSWRFDAQQDNDLDCVLHYTTRAPWLGGAARLVRSCLKDLQKRRRCRSTGSRPSSKDRFAEIFGGMRSRHCGHLLFQSDLCSMELPEKGEVGCLQ